MDLILITNDVARAAIAQEAGVDFIMVDLEINGKAARQGHLDTVISRHTMDDVARVRDVLGVSRLLVRVNPLFSGSEAEIDQCIALGADAVMLPMFTRAAEVEHFVGLVGGRAQAWLLLETPQAMVRADEIAQCSGVDAVHIGLNDLHLGLGLQFMFELLAHGVVERLATRFVDRGIKFGFGGVARLHGGMLDAALILSEHVRLRSQQVILSRDFQRVLELPTATAATCFRDEVNLLRREIGRLKLCSQDDLLRNRDELQQAVKRILAATQSVRA
jgi:hypothetical protein